MSEVIKTIEGVDKLFSEIEINNVTYKTAKGLNPSTAKESTTSLTETVSSDSSNVSGVNLNSIYHAIEDTNARANVKTALLQIINEIIARERADEQLQANINAEAQTREASDIQLQDNINTEESIRSSADTQLQANINAEAQTRSSADTQLQANINAEAQTRATKDSQLQNSVDTINSKIPSQATEDNQLADKDFVNSSIATNTANFINTFTDLEELKRQTATNNDYAYYKTVDSAGNTLFERWKYKEATASWAYEYTLNNSSFTADEWASIQSGITEDQVNAYDSHLNNTSNPHNVTKAQVGLGSVVNTGDSATPTPGGTTKFTTGGAYTELAKKNDKITVTDYTDNTQHPIADTTLLVGASAGTNPTSFFARTWLQAWNYIKSKAESVFVPLTRTVNGHALSSNVTVTKSDVGLDNVGNFKAVSTVASQGLTDSEKSSARANIGAGTSNFSGSYNDLTDKPTVPSGQIQSDWNQTDTNAVDYIKNKPTIPSTTDFLKIDGSNATSAGTSAQLAQLGAGDSNVTDNTDIVTSHVDGYSATNKTFYKRKATYLWNYIKGKADSLYVAKVSGKGLSTNDFTNTDKASITYYGTCSTSRATNAKAVSCDNFALVTGAKIVVKFTDTAGSAPTSGNITLNVNSTGAKNVYNKNNAQMTYSNSGEFRASRFCEFVYNGTNFVWLNYDSNTTYSTITQAEITAGTSTATRVVTPKLLSDNFKKVSDNSITMTALTNLNVTLVSADANKIKFNYFASNATNTPVATAGFVITHCMSTTSAVQTAFCGTQIFTRTLSGTTWSAWVAMWSSEENTAFPS